MSIKELASVLNDAIDNGYGDEEVQVFPLGFDGPVTIESAFVVDEDDAEYYIELAGCEGHVIITV